MNPEKKKKKMKRFRLDPSAWPMEDLQYLYSKYLLPRAIMLLPNLMFTVFE